MLSEITNRRVFLRTFAHFPLHLIGRYKTHVKAVLDLLEKESDDIFIALFTNIFANQRDKELDLEVTAPDMRPENTPDVVSIY